MGKLRTISEDIIRVDVIPHKNPECPPHITTYLNIYGTDHKGELMGMGNLSSCNTKEEVMLELGRVLLESSRNIKAWVAKKDIQD